MDSLLNWLRLNNDVLGFGIAALIFVATLVLVSKKQIGFLITLLLLLFSLLVGWVVANQDLMKDFFRCHLSNEKKETEQEVMSYLQSINERAKNFFSLIIPRGEQYWVCPLCNHTNSSDFTFCQECHWGK